MSDPPPRGLNTDFLHTITSWSNSFLDVIYPVNCRTCYSKLDHQSISVGYICCSCWKNVDYIRPPFCLRCGHPEGDGFGEDCAHCKVLKPLYFSKSRGIARYSGILRKAIHFWKYENKQDLGKPLMGLVGQYVQNNNEFDSMDVVIPVPLHQIKLREREFNQAELLSNPVSGILKIPVLQNVLYRTRYTRPQMELNAEERFKNVVGLFAINHSNVVQGKKVLLVDDVMTTGATVNACSQVLLDAGCTEVRILVLARG